METLFTPWRLAYITAARHPGTGCFFCEAVTAPDDPERLVVHGTARHLVVLNRHPYSNGHLMVAPREHLASPRHASAEARSELWPLVLLAQEVLEEAYAPDGLNVGLNLGQVAGAGVPDHFHVHLVPRWAGDTNFMTAVGQTRLIPEDLTQTRDRLRPLFARLAARGDVS
jgi:ATP adenylyltransferase